MQKNSVYTGVVSALGTNGEGIIKCGEFVAFVPNCLVGEEVQFKALSVKGKIAYGKVESIISPSAERIAPVCGEYFKCGGCQLQHASYSAQLDFKRQLVQNCLQKIGGIEVEVEPTVYGENQLRYRNKLALPIGKNAKGENILGFYAERSHRIVPISDCAIQSAWVKTVIDAVYSYMNDTGIGGYDEITKKGELRHIVVREINEKFIITLVATRVVNVKPLINILQKSFKNFTFCLNINASQSNVIFGKEWHISHGEGFFEAEDCGIKFKAGANTFLQVNNGVRTKLYAEVVKQASIKGAVALDLYSGGGMLTAMLAKVCQRAYGVEIIKEATECANELKELNGLQDKMINFCGKVEDKIDEILKATQGAKKIVVCDPPRKGMERSVIKAILSAKPEKIILVSCNPSTLARDLGLLCGTLCEGEHGQLVKSKTPNSPYTITQITPFDMFPQTKHVETLVCLKRK
ncbi:MAG: 23S rRNA (uracil(1939)-C(5))-methyltransferase RlmD [Clostridiales bacterium]|nr:23S rRNA (uracil(1939)-C(5))-methyltransferase RlmD [Clostridiales bacterium]